MKVCLYYRPHAGCGGYWQLVGSGNRKTLEAHMPELARFHQKGRIALVTVDHPSSSTVDLRSLVIRASHRNVLCKSLLDDWRLVRMSGRKVWRKVDRRQLALDLG